ncbi:hypothetical protein [Salicola sp. Rm-C-2C1-2]|uniref:hypothetical protein n=1 Tax=Salicola sp. Rm-C-2C1-2 TaxID=3141321 RepID=UPI0032E4A786
MRITIVLVLPMALAALMSTGCTTVDSTMEQQTGPEPVTDDRPLPSWNRLMNATLPVVKSELAAEGERFRPRAFVLSRRGGVRGVHIDPASGADDAERIELIFQSLEAILRGDEVVALVVYATGEGQLLNSRDQSDMVVVHLEHFSGRALLRRLSYGREDGQVTFGSEDVDRTDALVMGEANQ